MGLYICRNEVGATDISLLEQYFPAPYRKHRFDRPAGEHYKLLAHLSQQLCDATLIDAGTLTGISALALGFNRLNRVYSYDLMPVNPEYAQRFPNIQFKQLDINREAAEILKSAPLILLDIDPHDGIQETRFFEKLESIGYDGVVLLDDIHLNPAMESFWQGIRQPTYDVTEYAHCTGTGVADFSGEFMILDKCPSCQADPFQN